MATVNYTLKDPRPLVAAGLLSADQRRRVAASARIAWVSQGMPGDFDTWRKAEVRKFAGESVNGIRELTQEHYRRAFAHFLKYSGETRGQVVNERKANGEAHRQAVWLLKEACTEAGLSLQYARGIAKKKYQGETDLEKLNSKQVMHLVFSVRRKKQKATEQKAGGLKAGSVVGALMAGIKARNKTPLEPNELDTNEPF